jgi:hypothetical protein
MHGLHYWIRHPRLVRGQYARVALAGVELSKIKELPAHLRKEVPDEDASVANFYRCVQRIMTKVRAG